MEVDNISCENFKKIITTEKLEGSGKFYLSSSGKEIPKPYFSDRDPILPTYLDCPNARQIFREIYGKDSAIFIYCTREIGYGTNTPCEKTVVDYHIKE